MILREAGVEFLVGENEFDEERLEAKNPREFVYQATLGKHESARQRYGVEVPLLVADTVVVCRGELLRKAKNPAEAERFLGLQSGAEIGIITCMILETRTLKFIDVSLTRYKFGVFAPDALESYLASGLWAGKAGAVMVEGFCKPYIREVQGFESTARGLCVEKLLPWLWSENE